MQLLKRTYSVWCYFWFITLFLLLFPFFFIFLQKEAWKPRAHFLNKLWAQLYFLLCGIPVRVTHADSVDTQRAYVFCANHTSYLDIAVMGLVVSNYYAFIGKSSLRKIPLFGYMFRKLHIQVERESRLKSHGSFLQALAALEKGRSIVVFPEGGILTRHPPQMSSFKDGPFRMAIEKQVPVVPVTLPYNWKILPDDGNLLFTWHPIEAIVHPPIPTTGLSLADVEQLKSQTYEIIEQELKKHCGRVQG